MEELEHAEKFMKLQNQRGGKVILKDIRQPKKDGWDSCKFSNIANMVSICRLVYFSNTQSFPVWCINDIKYMGLCTVCIYCEFSPLCTVG